MPRPSEESEPPRGLVGGRTSAIAIVVAALTTLGVGVVMLSSSGRVQTVETIPAQPFPTTPRATAPALTPAPPPAADLSPAPAALPSPTPVIAAPAPPSMPAGAAAPPALAVDARGFVDSARCDVDQTAVAIARTERATVVVCEADDGSLEYQGVRLADGASLQLDDVRPLPAGFEARNDATTYRLSPTELVVISGEALQTRDAIIEYRAG